MRRRLDIAMSLIGNLVADKLLEWLSFFKFSSALNLDSVKKRGYQASKLFALLVIVPFVGKASMYALLQSGYNRMSDAGKDTYYRIKNRHDIDWDKLLHRFVKRFLKIVGKIGKSVKARRCLMTQYLKSEARNRVAGAIEGVGKVWDHVTMRYVLGFKLLVLGYYDGKSFLPVGFSLHREKGKKIDKLFGLSELERNQQRSTQREPDLCTTQTESGLRPG